MVTSKEIKILFQDLPISVQNELLEDLLIEQELQAKFLTNHTAELINKTVKESILEKSILFSDKSKSYIDTVDFVEIHITEKSNNN